MNTLAVLIITNLEKVGIGVGLFLCAYLANIGLGAWNSVKIDGSAFEWRLIGQSVVKFIVLGISIALLSCAVSLIPLYASYIGLEIDPTTLETIDSIVIISSFLTATIKYAGDAVNKLKTLLTA